MFKKIFYWGPYIDRNIATKKAIYNSAKAINQYSQIYKAKIINAIGEWNDSDINQNKELFYSSGLNIYQSLPKYGFIKSRFTFLIIFFRSWYKLKKILITEKPTYLIVHLIVSLPFLLFFFNNFKTKLILRISGKPKLNFIRLFVWKLINNKIHKIFCPTEETKELMINLKIFDTKKIFVLNDPVFEIKKFINKKNEVIKEKLFEENNFILIGRLTNQKNFDLIIDAYQKLGTSIDKYKVFIIGTGELQNHLKKKIYKYKLEKKIILLGKVENVHKYLIRSKAFILTSLWEDPGFVIIEAALNNLPIIASNCESGPSEILENGKGGYLFKNNNLPSLIKSLNLFLNDDKKKIDKMVLNSKKKIKNYSYFRHYFRLIELLNN